VKRRGEESSGAVTRKQERCEDAHDARTPAGAPGDRVRFRI
jgi:hypothetical protein